jgi:hypothetical protein
LYTTEYSVVPNCSGNRAFQPCMSFQAVGPPVHCPTSKIWKPDGVVEIGIIRGPSDEWRPAQGPCLAGYSPRVVQLAGLRAALDSIGLCERILSTTAGCGRQNNDVSGGLTCITAGITPESAVNVCKSLSKARLRRRGWAGPIAHPLAFRGETSGAVSVQRFLPVAPPSSIGVSGRSRGRAPRVCATALSIRSPRQPAPLAVSLSTFDQCQPGVTIAVTRKSLRNAAMRLSSAWESLSV